MARITSSEAEVLYQVALTIGSSLDLQQMLRDSCVALIRGLHAYGVQVWQYEMESPLGDLGWHQVFAMPKTLAQLQLANYDPELPSDQASFAHWQETLPQTVEHDDKHLYWFHLPQFGVLLLVDKGEPLPRAMLLNLQLLMNKLAHAAQACLYDQRLRAQYQELKSSSKAKSAFLATVSHEFRTPLNAILGFSDLLAHGNLAREQQQQLANVQKAAKGLLVMVDEILDFSKLSKKQLALEPTAFNLQDFCHDLIELFKPLAQRKGLDLQLLITCESETDFLADQQRLAQILKNLLGNAIKFTPRGYVLLKVELIEQDDAQDRSLLAFAVEDSGIGMSPEQQAAVFLPFHQADSSISRRFGGTGLGLSISQDLAGLMNTRIHLESSPDHGSRFHFRLWLPRSAPQQRPATPEPVAGQSDAAFWFGKTILVVEDAELNQLVISQYLQQMGIEVEIAADGFAALAYLQHHRVDLIFMDLHMPGIDGLETTERIRALPDWPDTPIVALTAAVSIEDRQACMAVGMKDFLAKPLDPQRLASLLLNYLGPADQGYMPCPEPAPIQPPAVDKDYMSQPMLERQVLEQLRKQLGDAALTTLLASLERTMQQQLPEMQRLLSVGDIVSLQRLAHSLKSTAATLGGMRVSTLAKLIEQACKEQARPQRLAFLLDELQQAWQQLSVQLFK